MERRIWPTGCARRAFAVSTGTVAVRLRFGTLGPSFGVKRPVVTVPAGTDPWGMNTPPVSRLAAPLLIAALVAGCSASVVTPRGAGSEPGAPSGGTASATPGVAAARIRLAIEVHRSPTCSCCHEWEAYLRAAGWSVRSVEEADMNGFKQRHGVPEAAWSCHTALVGGYVVEGHVPMEAIEDLLAARPAIRGIALPAMPAGSPGMPGVRTAPFEVLALQASGTSVFGTY